MHLLITNASENYLLDKHNSCSTDISHWSHNSVNTHSIFATASRSCYQDFTQEFQTKDRSALETRDLCLAIAKWLQQCTYPQN